MNIIEKEWEKFSNLIIPKNVSAIQKQEMRRAFYCGVEAMLRIQYDLGDSSLNEVEAVKKLEDIHKECNLFASEIIRGVA